MVLTKAKERYQGRIVEIGSHAELLRREGIYRRLHSLQETGELI